VVCKRPTLLAKCFAWKGFVYSSLGTSKANTYAGEGEGAGQGQGDWIDEELCYSVM